MTEEDRYRAPALDKGLDMLELLAEIDGGLTQAEIAKSLGRTRTSFTGCSTVCSGAAMSPESMATVSR